ncbi:MAG TPA: ABC transporter ATP-binding protein [Candidatus Dormibacteraeota bacterium]|nr:ABC transporter ATP-binding protein [Candidatus Dormibacteraeota bacterium]
MSAPLLRIENLTAHYGTAQILFGLSLEVPEGGIVALLGRNGAGKTTTLKSIMRIEARSTGTVEFDGRDLSRLRTDQIARAGVGYVPGDRRILADMTVRENLELGRYIASPDRPPASLDRILSFFPLLGGILSRRGGYLSGGEQQMLTIARCLIGSPRLMLLDEPSEGLAPKVVQDLAAILRRVHHELRTSILLTEQNTALALSMADQVGLIDTGRLVFWGPRERLAGRPDLMEEYLGVRRSG